MVFVDGALWQAISESSAAEPGDWVRVSSVHNLQLIVRPIDDDEIPGTK
jgi:membrane-bound serine protease (ClpP class)